MRFKDCVNHCSTLELRTIVGGARAAKACAVAGSKFITILRTCDFLANTTRIIISDTISMGRREEQAKKEKESNYTSGKEMGE